MATNFPDTSINNPNTGVGWANGDAFDDTAESGLIYYWYDPVWKTNISAADADDKYVEVDGDTMTGDLTVPSLNGGQLAGFRNQLINGDFRVWQRGNGPFSKPAAQDASLYTADRWALGRDVARNGTVTKQTNPANIPVGLGGAIRCSANTEALIQHIELVSNRMTPFAPGQTWTLSLWANVDITTTSPFLDFRDTNDVSTGTSMTGSDFIDTGEAESNGYSRYSSQFTIVEPSTLGTDLGSAMLGIRSHRDDNLNVDIRYSGIQLEPGPVATPFEHRPIGTELALCQRYYYAPERSAGENPYASAFADDFLQRTYTEIFPVTMRVTPTATANATNITGSVKLNPSPASLSVEVACSNAQASVGVKNYSTHR